MSLRAIYVDRVLLDVDREYTTDRVCPKGLLLTPTGDVTMGYLRRQGSLGRQQNSLGSTTYRMTSRPTVLSEANIVLRWWEDGRFSRFFSVVGITFSPSSHAYHVQHPQHQYLVNHYVWTFIRIVLK